MHNKLSGYLQRIGYADPVRTDLETLNGMHRAHLAAIPFENLDVQTGSPPSLDPDTIYDKLVTRKRGGWCYEMNGLFGSVLGEIGFDVTRVSAGVMRSENGNSTLGTHLALIVNLANSNWLVDVGFGGSLALPLLLKEGSRYDPPYEVRLDRIDSGYWRYTENLYGKDFSFDFLPECADERLMAEKSALQGRDPQSNFVKNLVVQMRHDGKHMSLRGRSFTEVSLKAKSSTQLNDRWEMEKILHERFGLDFFVTPELWDKVSHRHAELFG